MTIDHAARDFSRPYAASSDEGDRGETGSDRPAIAMTIVASRRGFQPYRRSLAPPCGSSGIIPQPPTLNHIVRQRDVYRLREASGAKDSASLVPVVDTINSFFSRKLYIASIPYVYFYQCR